MVQPIAGDENPETYGVPIASLHTDHVAADNTRRINYIYVPLFELSMCQLCQMWQANGQLIPPSRIPGFIFHQTERTADNGTNPCNQPRNANSAVERARWSDSVAHRSDGVNAMQVSVLPNSATMTTSATSIYLDTSTAYSPQWCVTKYHF